MDIEIKNICSIKEAKIKIDGLTIIAGENDTGKSTVGKLMFSIVKAINRYEEDFNENKEYIVKELIESLYFNIRRSVKPEELDVLKEEFHPFVLLRQLRPFIDSDTYQLTLFDNLDGLTELDNILNKKAGFINKLDIKNKDKIIQGLEKIKNELTQKTDEYELIIKALTKAFNSEFYFEITPKNKPDSISLLNCSEGENKIFSLKVKKNSIKEFKLFDQVLFNDVTFIESPVFIQLYDLISQAKTLFDINTEDGLRSLSGRVALHIKDLIIKLENAKYYSGTNLSHFEKSEFFIKGLNNIEQIMKGKFVFQRKEREFIFTKKVSKQNIQVKVSNTASGIKSFGIIQLLIQSGIIRERSLLIIDEPENHLHPEWQIKYAELIIELVKNNIYVLISSHSPYMIQALKVFSERNEITDKVNFYLSEKSPKSALNNIEDVTKDLNKVFIKLSQPFQDLVW